MNNKLAMNKFNLGENRAEKIKKQKLKCLPKEHYKEFKGAYNVLQQIKKGFYYG